jgi:hypothetical protein
MDEGKKLVNFKGLIEAVEKTGLRVCDIHLEETGAPSLRDYKIFTGSVVIKTFPEDNLLIDG